MAKKQNKNISNSANPKNIAISSEMTKSKQELKLSPNILWGVLIFVFALFCYSVFKNIQYPLFWADESMTVVGAERVLEFGYPKVHDGKNVFYDLRHSNPKLGIDEKTDAYIGGTSWGHYYFATIGVKLTQNIDDIYLKTGIIRFTFAFVGVLGLVLFVVLTSSILKNIEHKLIYAIIFFVLSLFSISLALLLREARYYSLAIFLFSTILGLYFKQNFGKPINSILFGLIQALLLVGLFFTFSPVFFIILVLLGVFEVILLVVNYFSTKQFSINSKETIAIFSAILVAVIAVYPFINYFKTFEISAAMAEFNGYSKTMFNDNLSTCFKYFKKFEFLWLALILKLLVLLNYKSAIQNNKKSFITSIFCIIAFVFYIYLIARIPNFVYTRYIILLIVVINFSIIIDFFILLTSNKENIISIEPKSIGIFVVLFIFILVNYTTNSNDIKGHITELNNIYKGPLDEVIPAIIDKYKKTDTLVVATNYEETSFIYYLKCKTTIGFIGNNLEEDSKTIPDVISYRKPWGNHIPLFQNFMQKAQYDRVSFEVYDNPLNNIPELNFMPAFNHQFKTKLAQNEQEKTDLYFKK